MINKEFYIKNVAESLALLSKQVEVLNAVNLYDINIIAEDFFPQHLHFSIYNQILNSIIQ